MPMSVVVTVGAAVVIILVEQRHDQVGASAEEKALRDRVEALDAFEGVLAHAVEERKRAPRVAGGVDPERHPS